MKVKALIKAMLFYIGTVRFIFHFIIFILHPSREIIKQDLLRWIEVRKMETKNVYYAFFYFLNIYPECEYRNLFYYRIGYIYKFINWFLPQRNDLFIKTKDIGPGFYIQHGFSTMISAKSIGKNCLVNQQVTIGYSDESDPPVIEDNVYIKTGAIVFGNITIGAGSMIGAGAVVSKNIKPGSVVVGSSSYYLITEGGKKIKKPIPKT